jgi:hypothetical protein
MEVVLSTTRSGPFDHSCWYLLSCWWYLTSRRQGPDFFKFTGTNDVLCHFAEIGDGLVGEVRAITRGAIEKPFSLKKLGLPDGPAIFDFNVLSQRTFWQLYGEFITSIHT